MTLEYRVARYGRAWRAWLRRPSSSRPLFYEGRTKHDAITALLNGVAKMASDAPGRLWGPDWTKAANDRAAIQAMDVTAPRGAIARDHVRGVLVSTVDRLANLSAHVAAGVEQEFEVYRSDTTEAVRFVDREAALKRHAEIVSELQQGAN